MNKTKAINKTNSKILGSIIKMNRIIQNMSQKALCEGICVSSYLSIIENAEIVASEEVLNDLFDALNIKFHDEQRYIDVNRAKFNEFFEELNFNEFEHSLELFRDLEKNEAEYVNSPLIIDYCLIKLAFYCTREEREVFDQTKELLKSVVDLMSNDQKFKYYLYTGIDTVKIYRNYDEGFSIFEEAKRFGENGHLYYWIGYTYLQLRNYLKAFEIYSTALQHYLEESNITSIIGTYEMMGLTYYYSEQYFDGMGYYEKALKFARKLNNEFIISNINNSLAWSALNRAEYVQAIELTSNQEFGQGDRSVSPLIIKLFAYMHLDDKENVKKISDQMSNIYNDVYYLLYRLSELYLSSSEYYKDEKFEPLLIELIEKTKYDNLELNKYLNKYLIEHYKKCRKYKDALSIMESLW